MSKKKFMCVAKYISLSFQNGKLDQITYSNTLIKNYSII